MKHANPKSRHAAVASWLVVAAFGLGLGAVGIGGAMDLLGARGHGSSAQAATTDEDDSFPGELGTGDAEGRPLRAGRVTAPKQLPNGAALPGSAPSAQVAKDGVYRPFTPTSIRLPSGRLAAVQPAGVHADGVLEIPANPDRVGWWTGGAEAGEPFGSIVLAGHVDSRTFGLGFLAEIRTMHPGQEVKLANGKNGQKYVVETVQKIPKAKLAAGNSLFDQKVDHRLVLITCGGPFDRATHSYRDNVVLVASPVS